MQHSCSSQKQNPDVLPRFSLKTDIIIFLSFHSPHRAAAQKGLQTTNFLLLNHICPIDRMFCPNSLSQTSEKQSHICFATAHSKNKCCTDSFALQKRQVKSSSFFLIFRLSLVRFLFFESNQRKNCTLGGTLNAKLQGQKQGGYL